MTYPIPDAAFDHHTVILGKTRAGKSSVARGIVERLLDQGRPVGIIDPKGDWWGLKSSADGKSPGYKAIIFGGEHADVPLNAHSGAHVAELVATGNRPFIIDLGGWMVGERTRFFIDFASTFFRHTRGPRHLVIDEAHNFAPQGKVHDPDAGKMLHWANRLASEGSGKGITLISASQRPQKVHKDYLTSHETLIAMRVIHPLDRGAVKDWIDGCPDAAKGKEVMQTLASMARGEGWAWCPEIGFGPEQIQFPMFATYDSFAAPTSEAVEKLKGWASVDLDDVRVKLAAVVEEAKANDPRALKAEVARLTKEVARLGAQPNPKNAPSAQPAWPDQRGEVDDLQGDVERLTAERDHYKGGFEEYRRRIFAALSALGVKSLDELDDEEWAAGLKRADAAPVATTQRRIAPAPAPVPRQPPVPREPRASAGNGALPGPQRRILNALAWWQAFGIEQPVNEQAAFIAGYSATSTGYTNPRGALKMAGLIDYPTPGAVRLTDEGAAHAEAPIAPPTGEELRRRVLEKMKGPARRILEPAIAAYPDALSNEEAAERAGYSASSTGYTNPRGSLKSLGCITYPQPGHVRAADWLFP